MAHRRTSLPRTLIATLTTALVSVIGLLVLAPAASARVSILPGSVPGGATEILAVRLANERTDVPTTRLELTFPADLPVPLVDVAPARGWTETVTMRPLDPPVTIGDEEFDEAVSSIVWEGGEVAPKEFEQFLVTAGPLPAEGRLVLTAVQGYADGTEDRWTDPAESGAAGAPMVVIVPGPAPDADQPTGGTTAGSDGAVAPDATSAAQPGSTPWLLLAGGVLAVAVAVAVVGRRGPRSRHRSTPGAEGTAPPMETVPRRDHRS